MIFILIKQIKSLKINVYIYTKRSRGMFTFHVIALFIKIEASRRDVKRSYNFK